MRGMQEIRKPVMLALATLMAVALAAKAETVTLKNGETFRGKIVAQTETEVQLETGPGAVLTFPRAQIESIEASVEPTPASTTTPEAAAASAAAAKEIKDLQAQVATLRDELKKLRDEVTLLRGGQAEVATRTEQVPEPRGDLPGEPSSKLELVNMRWSRAGDTIKVEGAIRNLGGSPGKWVRVTATVKGPTGAIIGRGETTPMVATPGVSVRDVGWIVPGSDLSIAVFVPFGGWSKETTFSSTSDVAKGPRRMPRLNEITVEWKLEVPPKFAEAQGSGEAGQKAQEGAGAGKPPASKKSR